MSRYYSYLESAKKILLAYKGEEPFASFIKKQFAQDKKYGSTDRKQISHLCYCYFRLGKALREIAVEERILTALLLCAHESNQVLQELRPEWNEKVTITLTEKLTFINDQFSIHDIFSWENELSETIDQEAFVLSHLQQPDLFLRIRPGKEETVKQKLTNGGIKFQSVTADCLAISNSSKVDKLVAIDKEAVVQDYSSQQVGEFIKLVRRGPSDREQLRVWDCCAASGGKSIMAKDILGDIELMVSDVRESILTNLEDRFEGAGIQDYESFTADLSRPLKFSLSSFNLVIADVPCTGSGTWSRTPEQLHYFDAKKIDEYAALQKKIVENTVAQIEPGCYLLYITCSVFKKENEEVVNFIQEKFGLQQEKMELLKGYDKKADTLFAALLQKPISAGLPG